ncbi:ABC transporter ATP-binding protein [Microlunatus parietis]|uniref:Putative ABC transport system ATP-binding protein n=1 Tax=Microlunatus parietis TaxID=682979 RepID=A0A7Y9L9F0_9ACTN|nr:ABC transporter ATP-binding protein [Microlunatus parietis]NYE69512.1 putative ABC transport system ATP-binding protein [Microlunatus parietis]
MTPVIRLSDVRRDYLTGETVTSALAGVSLIIEPGEFLAIVGPSGSGKSTMMNLIGCLDRPTAGRVEIAGYDTERLDDDALTELRSRAIGFVFQQFQLLPRMSALENVASPLLYQGMSRRAARRLATDVLGDLGLADRLTHDRTMLSGGQQQRVAIARAIVTDPALILADEPTGALDSRSGEMVMEILRGLNDDGRTIVLITHDAEVAAVAGRHVHLRDGKITSDDLVDRAPVATRAATGVRS